MGHVALYCRISEDDERRGEGVAEQEKWAKEYAEKTWPDLPAVTYVDNDISGADRNVERADFDRLADDIRAGRVLHLVARDRNRITRDASEWFDLVDNLFVPAGLVVIHTKWRGIMAVDDVATDFDAVMGRREVRVLRQLVLDKHESLARQGRPAGGRRLGYRHGTNEAGEATLEIIPEEADALRWAADAVLAGWSLTSICEEWDRRGLQRPRAVGKPWDTGTVSQSLQAPSIAGLRAHHGEIVRKGTWDPILDETTWRQVVATLQNASTVRSPDGKHYPVRRKHRKARRYLLTGGMAVCALCDKPLVGQKRSWNGRPEPIPYYICHKSKEGCQKIGISGQHFEDFVGNEFLKELAKPAFRAALESSDVHAERREQIVAELAELDSQSAELGRKWHRKAVSDAFVEAAEADRARQQADLSAELAALPVEAPSVDVDSIAADWGEATIEEKRHLLAMFIDRVKVGPAEPGKRISEETMRARVTIEWR